LIRSTIGRASPSTSRASPAPKTASTTQSAPERSTPAAGETFAAKRSAASAASPRSAPRRPRMPRSTAYLAGAAQNDDPAARPREARRFVRDRPPGRLHQRDPRRPARDRHPVGLAHLGGGQEMREVQGIEHEGKVGRRARGGKR
jgi:hypothetical protein